MAAVRHGDSQQPVTAPVASYAGLDSSYHAQSFSEEYRSEQVEASFRDASLRRYNVFGAQAPYSTSAYTRAPNSLMFAHDHNNYLCAPLGLPRTAPSTSDNVRNVVLPRTQATSTAPKQQEVFHNLTPQYGGLIHGSPVNLTPASDYTASDHIKDNLAHGVLNQYSTRAAPVSSSSFSPLSSFDSSSPNGSFSALLKLEVISQELAALHDKHRLSKNSIGILGQCRTNRGDQRRSIGGKSLPSATLVPITKTPASHLFEGDNYCEVCNFVVKTNATSLNQPHVTSLVHQTCCSRLIASIERRLQLARCNTHCPSRDKPRHVLSQAVQVAKNALKLDVLLKVLSLIDHADLGLSPILFQKDVKNIKDLQQCLKTKYSQITQNVHFGTTRLMAGLDNAGNNTRAYPQQNASSENRRFQAAGMSSTLGTNRVPEDDDDDDDGTVADDEANDATGSPVSKKMRFDSAVAASLTGLPRLTRPMPTHHVESDYTHCIPGMRIQSQSTDVEMSPPPPRRKYKPRTPRRPTEPQTPPVPKPADDESWLYNNSRDSLSHIVGSCPINALKSIPLPTAASWERVLGRADGQHIESDRARYARRTWANARFGPCNPNKQLITIDPILISFFH